MNQGAQKSIQLTEHIVLGSHIVTYPSHILHVTTACQSLVGWLCQTEVPAFQAPRYTWQQLVLSSEKCL